MRETLAQARTRVGPARPAGVSVAAILFAAVAGVFLATGVLFALAPDTLASSGFLASPSLSSDYVPLGLARVSCAALTWHLSRPHIKALFASSAAGARSPR